MDDGTQPLVVTYQDDLGAEAEVADFESWMESVGVGVRSASHSPRGPFAAVEWLLPTAVVVLIGKSYFEAFVREAGADHYHVVKRAIARLGVRFAGSDASNARLVYTKGKASSSEPEFSLLFSVYGETARGYRLKLLVPARSSKEYLLRATSTFVDALACIHYGTDPTGNIAGMEIAEARGGTILVKYCEREQRLSVVDPLNR